MVTNCYPMQSNNLLTENLSIPWAICSPVGNSVLTDHHTMFGQLLLSPVLMSLKPQDLGHSALSRLYDLHCFSSHLHCFWRHSLWHALGLCWPALHPISRLKRKEGCRMLIVSVLFCRKNVDIVRCNTHWQDVFIRTKQSWKNYVHYTCMLIE